MRHTNQLKVTPEEIYEFLFLLELAIIDSDKNSTECHCNNFSYEHLDNVIKIETSWACPEEGGSTDYIINLDKLEVEIIECASIVHGDYSNNKIIKLNSLTDFYNQYIYEK